MSEAKYYLNVSVFSNSTGYLHALSGTQVKVLSPMGEHINVVNVEDANGHRFPVNVDKLSKEPVFIDQFIPVLRKAEVTHHYKESFVYH